MPSPPGHEARELRKAPLACLPEPITQTVYSEELHKALARYIAHARKTGGTRRAVRGRSGNGSAIDTHKVREWARGQGIEIKDRGRVQADVGEKYRQATGQ